MENILELQKVTKSYPKSDFTLDEITFSLPYGSILGFVGENGSGITLIRSYKDNWKTNRKRLSFRAAPKSL